MRFTNGCHSPEALASSAPRPSAELITGAAKSLIGQRYPANYQMSGNEPPIEIDLPGRVQSRFSDNNQLSMYMHWAKMLQAKNWSEVSSANNG